MAKSYAIQSPIWPKNDKIDVNNFDDDFDDEPYIPPTEEELKQMEERRKKSDKISAEIARRMLQGWGLLGDHCPQEGCFVCNQAL